MSFSSTGSSEDDQSTQAADDNLLASMTSINHCHVRYNLRATSLPYRTIGDGNNNTLNQPHQTASSRRFFI
jgi:hypothetical protein